LLENTNYAKVGLLKHKYDSEHVWP